MAFWNARDRPAGALVPVGVAGDSHAAHSRLIGTHLGAGGSGQHHGFRVAMLSATGLLIWLKRPERGVGGGWIERGYGAARSCERCHRDPKSRRAIDLNTIICQKRHRKRNAWSRACDKRKHNSHHRATNSNCP